MITGVGVPLFQLCVEIQPAYQHVPQPLTAVKMDQLVATLPRTQPLPTDQLVARYLQGVS